MAQIVTITNPLTGQPAQVDQLDHTAQQIDDGIGFESTDYPGCYYRTVDGVVEWLNPPMQLGVEYRTTERHMSKPVYVKLVDFGALPNTDKKLVSTGLNPNVNSVLSIQGEMYNSTEVNPFPVFFSPGELKAYSYAIVSGSWHIGVRTAADLTGYNARFLVKYTKTTD